MRQRNYMVFMVLVMSASIVSSCEKNQQDYVMDNKAGILTLTSDRVVAEADGKSLIALIAEITPAADNKTVFFKTTAGTFLDSNKQAVAIIATPGAGKLTAKTWLVAAQDTSTIVKVNVSVQSVDTTLSVKFVTAYPDTIKIESVMAGVAPGYNSQISFITHLTRLTGKPSLHQTVNFSAYNEANQTIGDFQGISVSGSDSDGVVKSVFALKSPDYTGKILITASCTGTGNRTITSSTTIFITK